MEEKRTFMIELTNKIDKTLLPDMPRVTFGGIIEEIDTLDKARNAMARLSGCRAVGFDTETRPSFQRGNHHKVALLQLSTYDTAFLFRLNKIGVPDCVAEFLSDPDILKIGVSVKDDFNALRTRDGFTPRGFVDIPELCAGMGIEEKGLQKIYALFFHERISKNQQLSNWETDCLTESQRQYAAIDAWACLRLYDYIMELNKTGEYRVVRRDAEESNTEEG